MVVISISVDFLDYTPDLIYQTTVFGVIVTWAALPPLSPSDPHPRSPRISRITFDCNSFLPLQFSFLSFRHERTRKAVTSNLHYWLRCSSSTNRWAFYLLLQ